jgi:hypothetical protein
MLEVGCLNGNQQPERNRKVSHFREKLNWNDMNLKFRKKKIIRDYDSPLLLGRVWQKSLHSFSNGYGE